MAKITSKSMKVTYNGWTLDAKDLDVDIPGTVVESHPLVSQTIDCKLEFLISPLEQLLMLDPQDAIDFNEADLTLLANPWWPYIS